MSDLEQQARAIGLLLGGYGKAKNDENLIEWSNQLLAATLPENQKPQDTDSTEAMVETVPVDEPAASVDLSSVDAKPELIEPMGIDHSPAFEGYQPNGSLPETD